MLWNHGPSASARRLISSRLSVAIAFIASLPVRGVQSVEGAAGGPSERDVRAGRALLPRRVAQKRDRGPITVQRADIDIGVAGLDAGGLAAGGEIGVDEGANILVPAQALAPQALELVQATAGHLERAPDPVRGGILLLDLDLQHPALSIEDHGIEELGALDREEQEGQLVVRQLGERALREPDGIRQADDHRLVGWDQRR